MAEKVKGVSRSGRLVSSETVVVFQSGSQGQEQVSSYYQAVVFMRPESHAVRVRGLAHSGRQYGTEDCVDPTDTRLANVTRVIANGRQYVM